MSALVQAEGLCLKTPDGRVLQPNLSFKILPGEILWISGPNGAGKTTLLKMLAGHVPRKPQLKTKPGLRLGYVPQADRNRVHLPIQLCDLVGTAKSTSALLNSHQLEQGWATSSGGERKRALIMRALSGNPELLLLDEPMNHLDLGTRLQLWGELELFVSTAHRACAIVSHEPLSSDLSATRTKRLELRDDE